MGSLSMDYPSHIGDVATQGIVRVIFQKHERVDEPLFT